MTDFNTRNFGESRGDTNVAPVEAQTGTVRRYVMDIHGFPAGNAVIPKEAVDGPWVRFSDHTAALAAKDAEIARLELQVANEQGHNGVMARALAAAERERDEARRQIADHEEVHADKRRICREIEQSMYGDEGAKQPSLCDIQGSVRDLVKDRDSLRARVTKLEGALTAVEGKLAEYLERLLQKRTLPNRWVGEINDIVQASKRTIVQPAEGGGG